VAALDFPAGPVPGTRYSVGGSTWYYNGTAWEKRSLNTPIEWPGGTIVEMRVLSGYSGTFIFSVDSPTRSSSYQMMVGTAGVPYAAHEFYTIGAAGTCSFIMNGETGTMRFNTNLMWHAGNDGTGSGLDADTTDGYHAAEAASGSTLAARNSSGYLFATYFNQSSGLENYTISSVFFETGSDGYLRKMSLANFRAQATPSGLYTPTLTGIQNVTGTTAYQCQYVNNNGMVTVSGRCDVNATAAGNFQLGISLPIASNFGAIEDLGGTCSQSGGTDNGAILASVANDRATMEVITAAAGNKAYAFIFMYRII
jgi:hypothetical protein